MWTKRRPECRGKCGRGFTTLKHSPCRLFRPGRSWQQPVPYQFPLWNRSSAETPQNRHRYFCPVVNRGVHLFRGALAFRSFHGPYGIGVSFRAAGRGVRHGLCAPDGRNRHKGSNIAGSDTETGRLTRLFSFPGNDRREEHFQLGRACAARAIRYRTDNRSCMGINDADFLAVREQLLQEEVFPLA